MSTHKSKKMKKFKKHSNHEDDDDSEEEDEDESQNQYKIDDFVVDDNHISEGEDEEVSNDKSEAELDDSLASSDLELIGTTKKPKKKKLRKTKSEPENKVHIKTEQEIKDEKEEYQNELNELEEGNDEVKNEDNNESNFIENEEEEPEEKQNYEDEDIEMGDNKKKYKKKSSRINTLSHQIFSIPEPNEEEMDKEMIEKQSAIKNIYSKEELEEEYATEADMKIKAADYPERLLLRYKEEDLPKLSNEIEKEADWIFEQIKIQLSSVESISNVRKKVLMVLEFLKKEFLDEPFIATYRRYVFEPELTDKDIWKLFELDREWKELNDYKVNVIKQFNVVKEYLKGKSEFSQVRYIDNAKSIQELTYMEKRIKFLKELHSDDQSNKELQDEKKIGGYQRPVKKSLIVECVRNRINEYAEQFTMRANDLAVNLELLINNEDPSKQIHAPEPQESLGDLVKQYKSVKYDQELKIMEMALKFLAQEMASHPFIRQYVYNYFRANCLLSTEPTELGKKELDVFNPLFKTKRIVKKPITQFNNELYLYIVQAEQKGLIKVTLSILENEENLKDLKNKLCNAYMPNVEESQGEKNGWKIMREEAITMLVDDVLNKEFLEEVKTELFSNAEKFVINESAKTFYNLLSAGPYRKRRGNDDLFSENDLPKVMSFVFDPNKKLVYCVMLNKNGEVIDHCIFSNLAIRPPRNQKPEDRAIYIDEQIRCKNLIQQHKPELIIIGANDLRCRYLKEQIMQCDPDMMKSEDSLWVTFGDLSIPSIYANSQYSEKAFPNFSIFLRQAVSLGRYQQNPLEEILQLWNEDINKNFCLKMKLHPLQRMVSQKKLMEMMEQRAVQIVNNVGVDINKAFEFSHLKNSLMFVSGLGPRKAQMMLEKIIPLNGLSMRVQIMANSILGKRVRTSCNGFIKIKRDLANDDLHKYDLLDMTRIPLDMYPLANKLIKSALEDEHLKDGVDMVEVILKDPKKLEVLDCNEYIRKQTENQNVNAHSLRFMIDLIKAELNAPFKDPRKEHKDLTALEIFLLLIGDETFRVGQITLARVIKVDEQHVKCRLMNDLEATVWINDIFESNERASNNEMKIRYKEGTIFEAKIKSINENNYKIDLTTKPSVMKNHQQSMNVDELDPNFIITEEDYINRKYTDQNRENHQKYIPRRIVHEKFRNVNYKNCIDILRNRDIGDCLFRPSSRGINNITLSWKFYKNVYSHIDIIEEDKAPGAIISNKLRLGNEYYSSLSEINERYVLPCARLVKEVMQYRKFTECEGKSELDKRLKTDKSRDPSIIHYYLTILKDYPQYIILGYIPKTEMTCEYIKVKPSGFGFHNQVFKDIEEVINFFKKNYGTESYLEYVRKVKLPNVEFHRNIESKDNESNNNNAWNNSNNNYGVMNNSGRGNRDISNLECHFCHEKGHFAAQCPKKERREYRGDRRDRDRDGGERYNRGKRSRSPNSTNNYEDRYQKKSYNNNWNDNNNSNQNWSSNNNNNTDNNGWGTTTTEVKTEVKQETQGWGTTAGDTNMDW